MAAIVVGNPFEILGNAFGAAAESSLGVRVIVAPHDRRQPGDVAGLDRGRVIGELDVDLALYVFTRLQRPWPFGIDAEQPSHGRLILR
ncbi:hypothetical protein ACQP2U_28690 [Nocardia sp. CA-084685]|uniref:hypothetical protein n=1 Tax=Nocardia sp. CA-084685 TaxID=3239970 RepID=UPI003D995388